MDDKYTKLSVIALIFALIALNAAGTSVVTGIYTFVAGTGIAITGNDTNIIIASTGNFTDNMTWENTKVNKSGDTMIGTLIVPTINTPYIYNPTQILLYGGNSQLRLNGTTRFDVGGSAQFEIDTDESNSYNDINMNGFNITDCGNCGGSDNLSWVASKVNKSGDYISGNLNLNDNYILNATYMNHVNATTGMLFIVNRTYTGTANPIVEYSQSSSPVKLRVIGNDLTAGWNLRVNAKGDQSQDDVTIPGYAVIMKPYPDGGVFEIWRSRPGTTTTDIMFTIISNQSTIIPTGDFRINSLSGTGNDYACVYPNGTLFRSNTAC